MTIKIFLGNLSSDTTAEKVRPLFEKFGQVVECDVLKNFGFVHMVNRADANKAIAQLDGYSIDGNNIRVELSTGKKGPGGGGGKFDKKGFGGPRQRPYGGGPPGRGGGGGGGPGGSDPRDFDRYPFPPMPPMPAYERYRDPYYRYLMEREAYYARMERTIAGSRDRGYPPLPPRDRLADAYPDPRDRLMPARSYLEERTQGLSDPYFRERDTLAARPPPEYYDRKPMGGRPEGAGAAGGLGRVGASGMGSNGVGGGQFDRFRDLPVGRMGGAGGGAGNSDFFRPSQNSYGRPGGMGGMGKSGDAQASFAQDAIFF